MTEALDGWDRERESAAGRFEWEQGDCRLSEQGELGTNRCPITSVVVTRQAAPSSLSNDMQSESGDSLAHSEMATSCKCHGILRHSNCDVANHFEGALPADCWALTPP